jgi:ATP-dependent Zn protease
MKNAVVYLIIIAGLFISCTDKRQEITLNEFDRLIKADSIQSLHVYNDEMVVITKRSSLADDEKLVLLIPSADFFRDQLDTRYSKNKIPDLSFIRNGGSNFLFVNLIPLLLMLCFLIFFLIAAIDILKNRFSSDVEKLIWILVVIFVPLLGPILYLLIGTKQKLSSKK